MQQICVDQTGCRHARLLAMFDDHLPGNGTCGDRCDLCHPQEHVILPRHPEADGRPPKDVQAASAGRKAAAKPAAARKKRAPRAEADRVNKKKGAKHAGAGAGGWRKKKT